MKSARDPSAASGRRLLSLIESLLESAQRDVGRLKTQEAVATHQLRVRMKKLLSLLRLGRDCVPEQTFEAMRMHIRAVKNACAGNRDVVVRDKLVEKLSRRFHLSPQHALNSDGSRPEPTSASFLRHQLYALEQLVDRTSIEKLTPEQIIAAHAITYRRGRRLMKESFDGVAEESLHRWRHRVKDLHYQTLAIRHLPGACRRVRRARKLGSLLGHERDLANLAREPAYAAKRGSWSHLIQEHRSKLRQRILILGHKLYDAAAKQFQHQMERRMELA
ncbi:MAG: hypothetical protein RIS79_3618 [Verrucomicrobiota bacterium]|jgi:hypothetical protein